MLEFAWLTLLVLLIAIVMFPWISIHFLDQERIQALKLNVTLKEKNHELEWMLKKHTDDLLEKTYQTDTKLLEVDYRKKVDRISLEKEIAVLQIENETLKEQKDLLIKRIEIIGGQNEDE